MQQIARIKVTFLLIIISFLSSCESKEAKIIRFLDSSYILEEIKYKGEDLTNEVIAAIMSFEADNGIKFKPPIISNETGKKEKYSGKMIETKNKFQIQFATENRIFKEAFDLSFEIEESKKQIILLMESEHTFIRSTRVFIMEDFEKVKRDLMLL
ncbi:hypothetical protein [Flagellimonas sp. 2504JD4-2]